MGAFSERAAAGSWGARDSTGVVPSQAASAAAAARAASERVRRIGCLLGGGEDARARRTEGSEAALDAGLGTRGDGFDPALPGPGGPFGAKSAGRIRLP